MQDFEGVGFGGCLGLRCSDVGVLAKTNGSEWCWIVLDAFKLIVRTYIIRCNIVQSIYKYQRGAHIYVELHVFVMGFRLYISAYGYGQPSNMRKDLYLMGSKDSNNVMM